MAAGLIGLGRSSGASLAEMGLRPVLSADDLRLAGATAATAAIMASAAVAHPRTRALLRDERARDAPRALIRQRVLIRFPLGTAMFEEVVFRGVLPRLLARSEKTGDLLSTALFGLWHVIPTARVLRGNPIGRRAASSARAVAAGSVAAAAAGHALVWARRTSGSVVLPWLLHSIFNITSYLAGVVAWRFHDRKPRYGSR